jgi:hypothetical protein
VWKRVPLLRQAMQRCNLHMNLAGNLLEMATDVNTLNDVNGKNAIGGQRPSGTRVTANVGENFAAMIHSEQHPRFGECESQLILLLFCPTVANLSNQ